MDVAVTAFNLAGMYGLMAIGISLTWAGLGFLNLSHGVTFAAAGYGGWWATQHISSHAAVVLVAGIIMGALAGAIIWLVVFLPLDGRPNWELRTLIATLALSFIGTTSLLVVFGPLPNALPAVFGTGSFEVAGAVITNDRIGAIGCAVVVLGLAVFALTRSRIGLGVRALTQNTEGAAMVGIDRRSAAFAILTISAALAGLASILLAQTFYVSPESGYVPLVKGLMVALLGGLGSIPGTILAALLIGGIEAVTATYLGQQYVLMTLFLLIAVVLLVRPRGIGGILEAARA